ncbi:MAG: HAD family hydrolase [Bacteroidaceae bacterium]|nr:HAD family hydrolase [Bacteroidaceae bacterium]
MKAEFKHIRGVIFDYGGTIDTNGCHWAEVLWEGYCSVGIPVSKIQFREAYVQGERTLATQPLIKPEHDFLDVLRIKTKIQIDYLISKDFLTCENSEIYAESISQYCMKRVQEVVKKTNYIVERISFKHKLVLVSNFYGNIRTVLENFHLLCRFDSIIESAVVGVRKPDPKIFTLGVEALQLKAEEVVVIGDSFSKDILPARKAGCHTIWLKGPAWEEKEEDESLCDAIIADFKELEDLLL